jgi:hypothetical protein
MESKASLMRLVETFQQEPAEREEAASALVRRGRAHFAKDRTSKMPHLILVSVGNLAARQDLDPSIRAKAVWVLAEIGSRRARKAIEGAYAGDSMAVAEEVKISRDKLGFTSEAHPMECLGDGRLHPDYDPQERGHVEEVEE